MKMDTKIAMLDEEQSQKLFKCDMAYVGFCGPTKGWGNFLEWLTNMDKRPPKLGGTELIALTNKGEIYSAYSPNKWMKLEEKFASIGSGMQFAIAALEAGKTAKEAIRIAAKRDPGTGMGVKEYKI